MGQVRRAATCSCWPARVDDGRHSTPAASCNSSRVPVFCCICRRSNNWSRWGPLWNCGRSILHVAAGGARPPQDPVPPPCEWCIISAPTATAIRLQSARCSTANAQGGLCAASRPATAEDHHGRGGITVDSYDYPRGRGCGPRELRTWPWVDMHGDSSRLPRVLFAYPARHMGPSSVRVHSILHMDAALLRRQCRRPSSTTPAVPPPRILQSPRARRRL